MKFARASKPLSLAVFIALISPLAMADNEDAGWYIGGSLGNSRANIDKDSIVDDLTSKGFDTTSYSKENSELGYKLLGGYQFNKNFALEGGYFDLGTFGYKATTIPTGTLAGDLKVKGLNIDLVGNFFFTENFSVLGRLGAIHTKTKDDFTGTGVVTPTSSSPSKSDTNYKYGVGLQYALTDALNVRTEVERYRINDAIKNKGDVDLVSLGVTYRFGTKKNKMEEVKEEKKVESVIVVTKAKPLTFEDVHFGFDESSLTKEAEKTLTAQIKLLKKNPGTKLRISGHTSAAGTAEYNQALSERRAQTIKDYLVQRGIKPSQLSIIGYGDRRPARYEAAPENIYSPAAKANMRVLFEIIIK